MSESWVSINEPGFGNPEYVTAEAAVMWNRTYYVGAQTTGGRPAKIWARNVELGEWQDVTPADPEWAHNEKIKQLVVFRETLYIATDQGQLWTFDGTAKWTKTEPRPSFKPIEDMIVFRQQLYLAFGNGVFVVCLHEKPDGTTDWLDAMGTAPVIAPGFGRPAETAYSARFGAYQGRLYLGIGRSSPGGDKPLEEAVQVWEYDGENWQHRTDGNVGFGDSGNGAILAFQGHKDHMYAGTHNASGGGAQVWRAPLGTSHWENATPAWGTAYTRPVHAHCMTVSAGRFYVGTRDPNLGALYMTTTPEDPSSWAISGASGSEFIHGSDIVSTLTNDGPFLFATVRPLTGGGVGVYRRDPSPDAVSSICAALDEELAWLQVRLAGWQAMLTDGRTPASDKPDIMDRIDEINEKMRTLRARKRRLGCP